MLLVWLVSFISLPLDIGRQNITRVSTAAASTPSAVPSHRVASVVGWHTKALLDGNVEKRSLVFKLMKFLWFNDTDLYQADRYKTAICWNVVDGVCDSVVAVPRGETESVPRQSVRTGAVATVQSVWNCHFYFITWYFWLRHWWLQPAHNQCDRLWDGTAFAD